MVDLTSVVAVIYNNQLRYGAFVDQGPTDIIGEASYAMAELLGINPDPAVGGTDGPVTYIAFQGADAMVPWDDILDYDPAVAIGESQSGLLVERYGG